MSKINKRVNLNIFFGIFLFAFVVGTGIQINVNKDSNFDLGYSKVFAFDFGGDGTGVGEGGVGGCCGGSDSGFGPGDVSGFDGPGGGTYNPPINHCTNGATNYPYCNNNTCSNGATNYPYCNNNVCTNGATNYPHCNNNYCTNGATNYPACNTCPTNYVLTNGQCVYQPPVCSNGATNYPYCNNNTCTNGATNFPYCNNQCTPLAPETQYLNCSYGQTGNIIQTRTYSCPGNYWNSWVTTSNTCQNINYSCTNGATNYPYCNNNINYVWCNGVQYVAPYICPVINQYNLSVSTTGATPLTTTATINGYVNPYNNGATIWFDYGTNYNLSYQTTKQNTSYSGAFNANLSGLTCGTRYYYRAAAQNNVETKYGATLSFVTPNCYVAPVVYENLVITRLATKVGAKSAQLNGSFVNNSGNINSCVAFFDYGTNYNLSKRTAGQNLYASYTTNYFSQGVYGLAPNTTYYYRAGVTCLDGTKFGNVYKFTTGYVYTVVAKKKIYTQVEKPVNIVTDNGKCNCDIPEYMSINIEALEGEATIGKIANYRIFFKNVSESPINNVVVRVVLPEELTILSADKGQFTKDGKTLTLAIPMLQSLQEGYINISTNVNSKLEVGRKIVVNVYADYTTPTLKKSGNINKGEVTAYTISVAGNGTSIVNNNSNNFGNSSWNWMPQNWLEWLIFAVVFLIFLSALRYLFSAFSK